MEWQARLAAAEGIYAEASSVAGLAAVRRLRDEGVIEAGASVVVLSTAGGLTDPAPMALRQGELPRVPSSFEAACEAPRAVSGFTAGGG